jgi:hypothetical protein
MSRRRGNTERKERAHGARKKAAQPLRPRLVFRDGVWIPLCRPPDGARSYLPVVEISVVSEHDRDEGYRNGQRDEAFCHSFRAPWQ